MRAGYSLDRFFETGLKSDVQRVLITKDKLNRYSLFSKYQILPTSQGYYKVISDSIEPPTEFIQLKNAVIWCTLHNARKHREANRIIELDMKLSSIEFDLVVHRNILKRAEESDTRLIYMMKIQEDVYKRRMIMNEITSHLKQSKNIQAAEFARFKKPIT